MISKPIDRQWAGEVAVCIGGGPSLTRDDVEYVRGKAKVIAINDAHRLAPWADIMYACDLKWWDWHNGCHGFEGRRWTVDEAAALKHNLRYIKGIKSPGLSDDQSEIHTGSNSGFQAINIAYLMGASKIILIGYDMKVSGSQSHWFGDHPDKIISPYHMFINALNIVAKQNKIEIINSTRDTALKCFPQIPLREIL